MTSFSSAGPTNYDHALKPDLAAPGSQILSSISSTLAEFHHQRFAVLDGTSMSAPHVSGAAALLLQQHPTWTPREVKSALMSSAGPAWGDTARTHEAPVLLEGSGLVNVAAANDPKLFTGPPSLSFGYLDTTEGKARLALLLSLTDAGGGAGTWTVSVDAQAASSGAAITPGASILTVAPGGTVDLPVAASAPQGSPRGDNYGFIVLQRGADRVRVPYYFSVVLPQIGRAPIVAVKRDQTADTSSGTNFVNVYRFPADPFGPPSDYTGPGMHEDGAEHVYSVHVNGHDANVGAAVIASGLGALVEPWFLGSLNEDDVQGYPGTPLNVNGLTFEYEFDNGAAGVAFPPEGRYFVAVDSRADPFTDEPLRGPYLLRFWRNDVTPPKLHMLTGRVSAGHPLLAGIVTDRGSGVDPLSLVIGYKNVLLLAALYDPSSGLVVWLLDGAPKIGVGKTSTIAIASDYQESKNVDQAGENILPNTVFRRFKLRGVKGPSLSWLLPKPRACAARRESLLVSAGSTRPVRSVTFYDGGHKISRELGSFSGIYGTTWKTGKARRGRHVLLAVVRDRRGARAEARRIVRVCHR